MKQKPIEAQSQLHYTANRKPFSCESRGAMPHWQIVIYVMVRGLMLS